MWHAPAHSPPTRERHPLWHLEISGCGSDFHICKSANATKEFSFLGVSCSAASCMSRGAEVDTFDRAPAPTELE